MTFAGVLRYASVEDLDAAIAAVEALLEDEDDFELPLRRRGLELRVELDIECPRDWYLAYEALIEALTAHAREGEISGEIDRTITSYGAGRQAA